MSTEERVVMGFCKDCENCRGGLIMTPTCKIHYYFNGYSGTKHEYRCETYNLNGECKEFKKKEM